MTLDLRERARITQDTLDHFQDKPFVWHSRDCGALASHHARACGKEVPTPRPYKTARGALRAIRELGHSNLEALVDSLFEPIAPAFALPGDLIAVPASEEWGVALGLYLGNERLMAFADRGDGDP